MPGKIVDMATFSAFEGMHNVSTVFMGMSLATREA